MSQRFANYLLIAAGILVIFSSYRTVTSDCQSATIVSLMPQQYTKTIAVLPLDSRPACTQLVEQLAVLANTRVLLPPAHALDNYIQPGNRPALAEWLQQAARQSDALIISSDMLLTGGLLASRVSGPAPDDIAATLQLLTQLRHEHPQLKIMVFHIIPRLLIADHSLDQPYQWHMEKYSVLKEQISIFENPRDIKKLTHWEQQIPPAVIERYSTLYQEHEQATTALLNLLQQNTIDMLVVGQDDAYPFGMPNLTRERLKSLIAQNALQDRALMTNGADEIALALLSRLSLKASTPIQVYVDYSTPEMSQMIMPYMPNSVASTIKDKINLLGVEQTLNLEIADIVLFVHAGHNRLNKTSYTVAAERLKNHIQSGRTVALVDLTENFYAAQTLLPYAIANDSGVRNLAAYAGWNTTGNAVGTALAQAILYSTNKSVESDLVLRHEYNNLTFLVARLLDDWHYLKNIQPHINRTLRRSKINPYQLQSRRPQVEAMIQAAINQRSHELVQQVFWNRPLFVAGFTKPFFINQIKAPIILPWPRTFEIKIMPELKFVELRN